MGQMARTHAQRLSRTVAIGAMLVMAATGGTIASPDTGDLPKEGFTWTSVVDDGAELTLQDVYARLADASSDSGSPGMSLDIDAWGSVAIETAYEVQAPGLEYQLGWYAHSGPVILTVTAGTMTFVDDLCQRFDLVAGHSYIRDAGQAFNAVLLPEKNRGVAAVAWFTTRLYPEGAPDPVPVDAPCAD